MSLNKAANPKKNVIKKKPSVTLKHILAQPFPRYWPQINEEKTAELTAIIEELTIDAFRPSTIFGLKQITRKVQSDGVQYLLLSTEIKPNFITNLVISLAVSKRENVCILVVPNLSTIFKKSLQFGPLAIAVEDSNSEVARLIKWISETSKLWPIPQKIGEYFFPSNDEAPKSSGKAVEIKKEEIFNVSSLYLKSGDLKERAFVPRTRKSAIKFKKVPEKVKIIEESQIESEMKMDFISFGSTDKLSKEEAALNEQLEMDFMEKSLDSMFSRLKDENVKKADHIRTIGETSMEAPDVFRIHAASVPKNTPKLIMNPPKPVIKKNAVLKTNLNDNFKNKNSKRSKNGKIKKGQVNKEKTLSSSQKLSNYISLTVHKIKNDSEKIKKNKDKQNNKKK